MAFDSAGAERLISPGRPVAERHAGELALLLWVLLLGVGVRLYFTLGADFPLHDGGLFYAMVRDLQSARYALPAATSYNSAGIPFAYPPLALYLAGLLDDLTPLGLLDVFRFLPLAASLLSIGAFALLARSMLGATAAAGYATAAFALLPEGFRWAVMGGGVTRAPGQLLALLALHQAHLAYRGRGWRRAALAGALAGGAALSHPELGLFTAYSLALLGAASGRRRAGLSTSAVIALGAAATTAPWWGTVVARQGLAPFLSAAGRGGPPLGGVVLLFTTNVTNEQFFPVLGALALLGLAACLGSGRPLLPVWLLATFALQPRGARLEAAVPLALLAGIGVAEGLLPLLGRGARPAPGEVGRARPAEAGPARPPVGRLALATLAFVTLYALFGLGQGQRPYLAALPPAERQAMAWVAEATPPDSAFLVVTSELWGLDRSSEWFPVLARRVSAATVQGFEWAGAGEYARRLEQSAAAQACASQGAACLEGLRRGAGVAFTHVYLPKRPAIGRAEPCCGPLREALRRDPGYALVYDGPGAIVYRRLPDDGTARPALLQSRR